MKWFKHFSNAHDNNKLTKLRARYGADGYAIYWYCLELVAGDLGNHPEINFELKHDAEVIGLNLKIDTLRVEEIMRFMVSLELFEEAHGVISCLKLAKYLDKKTTRNETIRAIIDAGPVSATVPDKPRPSPTNRDCPETSRLDTDTDSPSLRSGERRARRREQLPDNFTLTDARRAVLAKKAPRADAGEEFERFCDHHRARGTLMLDWDAAWRTWCGRVTQFNGGQDGAHDESRKSSAVERVRAANPIE